MSMTVLYHMLLQGCTSVILFLFLGSPVLGSSTVPIKPTIQFELSAISTNNLHKPIFLTHAENKNGRLYIVEQKGKIRILEKGRILSKPFLDISTMLATGGEQGLLGLAFHPNYQKNGRYFINYVRKQDRATVIAEYHRSSNPNRSDTKAEI
ncbi:MAG: PQQ-dependent sugar dehydrogenase, partial [Nitrospirales bacterium]